MNAFKDGNIVDGCLSGSSVLEIKNNQQINLRMNHKKGKAQTRQLFYLFKMTFFGNLVCLSIGRG